VGLWEVYFSGVVCLSGPRIVGKGGGWDVRGGLLRQKRAWSFRWGFRGRYRAVIAPIPCQGAGSFSLCKLGNERERERCAAMQIMYLREGE